MSEIFILVLITIMAVAIISSAVVSALSLIQAQRTHVLINSRMDQLIKLTAEKAHREGVLESEASRLR